MYEIPHAPEARPLAAPSLLQTGLEWLIGYTALGAAGGAAAFGLMRVFEDRLGWSDDKSLLAAWALVALVCGPLAIVIQQRALRSSGLRFRRWIRASWMILVLLGLGSAVVIGGAAIISGRSPISVVDDPRSLLAPLERLLGVTIVVQPRTIVLGIRGLAGLLIGLAQAQVWRAQRLFFAMWVAACAGAGLASGLGESAGAAVGTLVYRRLCAGTPRPCAASVMPSMVYGACMWGLTWLAMALVTAGPALYLIRRLR